MYYRQTGDLQNNGVVKANISECPVHYHHVCVEDLSTQLQQAEHCTPMKLCDRTRWRGRAGDTSEVSSAFIHMHHLRIHFQPLKLHHLQP